MTRASAEWTPGPWDYIEATENNGPYVTTVYGGTICDLYVMSTPSVFSPQGLDTKPAPVHFFHEMAAPNARLIAAAPDLYEALKAAIAVAQKCNDVYGDRLYTPQQTDIDDWSAALLKATGEQP